MQEKKDNINKVLDITTADSGVVKISIKDGYQNGDILDLNLTGINHTWSFDHKELIITADKENLNINNILENISLKSIEQNDTERFISVEYITEEGENLSLKEYVLNKQDDKQDEYVIEKSEDTYKLFSSVSKEKVLLEDVFAFDYEETHGADFLESSIEEKIPFEINLEENGDIYKILKDSFSEGNDFLEIHGYDISHDKVSLEEFSKEFGEAFDYRVSADNVDLNLNIFVENHEYSVVLKDVISDTDSSLDDIIQNLIINNSDHKI